MQDNVVAIDAIDVGTPRVPAIGPKLELGRILFEEARHNYECYARKHISGSRRKVFLQSTSSRVGTDSLPLKVFHGVHHMGQLHHPQVRQMSMVRFT